MKQLVRSFLLLAVFLSTAAFAGDKDTNKKVDLSGVDADINGPTKPTQPKPKRLEMEVYDSQTKMVHVYRVTDIPAPVLNGSIQTMSDDQVAALFAAEKAKFAKPENLIRSYDSLKCLVGEEVKFDQACGYWGYGGGYYGGYGGYYGGYGGYGYGGYGYGGYGGYGGYYGGGFGLGIGIGFYGYRHGGYGGWRRW